MGLLPPYARVYCAVWSIPKPNETLSHGLGLNASQIDNKLRRSAKCERTASLKVRTGQIVRT